MRRLIVSACTVLRRRGVGYLFYVSMGSFAQKALYHVAYKNPLLRFRRFILRMGLGLAAALLLIGLSLCIGFPSALVVESILSVLALLTLEGVRRLQLMGLARHARALTRRVVSTCDDSIFTDFAELPVDPSTREAIEQARQVHPEQDLVIGHIDYDLRVRGLFGGVPILPPVGEEEFLERPRFQLDIVLIDNKVLVRKDFRGDRLSFLHEWRNLALLHGRSSVPAVYRVDEPRTVLYKNLILGRNLRDILLEAGARIMYAQTKDDSELQALNPAVRSERVAARGTAVISQSVPETVLCEMERQIEGMHRCGMTRVVPTFGNIILEQKSGQPFHVDLEGARLVSVSSPIFPFLRDQDRMKFNCRFGRNLLTEESARQCLAVQRKKMPGWYAPIDYGNGLTVGGFWSTDSGTGRWEFLNRKVVVPLVVGKRVLDLGSNNGLNPLLMLREGAREVVGAELSQEFVESAHLVHRIFEWRDMRQYSLTIHNCNMLEVLRADWGKFDLVTAFCSLYYLTSEDMARVVRRAAELAPRMVLQANVATRKEAADGKAEKSSVEFLKRLLGENGFPQVEIHAPKGFSRPLLVGSASDRMAD